MRAVKYQNVIHFGPPAAALALLLAAAPAPAPAAGPGPDPSRPGAIRAARLWTGSEWLEPGVLVLSGGRVASAGRDLPAGAAGPVLDLPGAVLTPGWIDAASRTGIEGGESEESRESTPCVRPLRAFDPRARSVRAALASGVTSLLLEPGGANVIGGVASVVKTVPGPGGGPLPVREEAALRIAFGDEPSAGNFPARGIPFSIYARRPTTRMGVLAVLRDAWMLGRLAGREAPSADDAALARAAAGEIPVRALARNAEDLRTVLRVREELGIRPVLEDVSEGWLLPGALAKAGLDCVVGPAIFPVGGRGWGWTEPALDNAGALHRAGVRIALTAGGESAGLRDQAALAVRHGLPRDAALAAVTAEAARMSGVADRVGALRPGLDADAAVFDGDPLEPSTRVLLVIVDGKVVLDRRAGEEAR